MKENDIPQNFRNHEIDLSNNMGHWRVELSSPIPIQYENM